MNQRDTEGPPDWRIGRVYEAIYGNGKDGLEKRVDRLEQARLSRKEAWALYVGPLVSGILVAVIPLLWDWLARHY